MVKSNGRDVSWYGDLRDQARIRYAIAVRPTRVSRAILEARASDSGLVGELGEQRSNLLPRQDSGLQDGGHVVSRQRVFFEQPVQLGAVYWIRVHWLDRCRIGLN